MIFHNSVKLAEKFVQDNSTAILTGIGVVGTLTASYLTGRATLKAVQIVDQARLDRAVQTPDTQTPAEFTKFDILKLVWIEYVPPAGALVVSVACIICANRIGTRRAAAMAAAYKLSDKKFSEYKEKVLEKVGIKKEQEMRDEIAQNGVTKNPPCSGEVVLVGTGDVLFKDAFSGRYFQSTMEDVKKAQNDMNYEIIYNLYGTLSDFYNHLGLPAIKMGHDLGWNSDHPLELTFSTTLTDDMRPCIVMDFDVAPVRQVRNEKH